MPHAPDSWWEIEVTGDKHALRFLEDVLESEEMSLTVAGNRHVLRVRDLDGLEDAGVVRSRARTLISAISGSTRLVLGWSALLEVGHITRRHPDGRRDYFLEVQSGRLVIRSMPVSLRVTRADGTVEETGPADELLPWLALAERVEAVRRVLRLISEPDLSWVELYRILEIIHDETGSEIFEWAPRGKVRLFKHTANSVGAVGDAARHGRERGSPPANPMHIRDGRRLIVGLARGWLNSLQPHEDQPGDSD